MRAALPALVALSIVAAVAPSRAQNANPLPPGDSRDLVAAVCSQCHYLGTIAKIRDGAAGWRVYVDNMVLRRSCRPGDRYRGELPGAQSRARHNLPRPSRSPCRWRRQDLVETQCSVCHDLERVAIVKRDRRTWPVIVADMVAWAHPQRPAKQKPLPTISPQISATKEQSRRYLPNGIPRTRAFAAAPHEDDKGLKQVELSPPTRVAPVRGKYAMSGQGPRTVSAPPGFDVFRAIDQSALDAIPTGFCLCRPMAAWSATTGALSNCGDRRRRSAIPASNMVRPSAAMGPPASRSTSMRRRSPCHFEPANRCLAPNS